MLREKPVHEKTMRKYAGYLAAIERCSLPHVGDSSLAEIAKLHYIDQTAGSIIVELGIVKKVTRTSWEWKSGERDNFSVMALQVLNKILSKKKKKIHVPIPEFATIGDTLKTIAERLAHITLQHEKSLKTSKTGEIINERGADLFMVDEQRLYIAGQIASTQFKDVVFCQHEYAPQTKDGAYVSQFMDLKAVCMKCGHEANGMEINIDQIISERNNLIIKATDDLMAKLLKRDLVWQSDAPIPDGFKLVHKDEM